MAFLLILAVVALPALTTAAPPDCRVRPLTDAEYLALEKSILEDFKKELGSIDAPNPSEEAPNVFLDDMKPGFVPAIGIEIVEAEGCPDSSH